MFDLDHAVRAVSAVHDLAGETLQALRGMKTPKAAFEESAAAVQVRIDQALESHRSAQSCADVNRFRLDVHRHFEEMGQLKNDQRATLDAKNKDFERQQRLAIEDFCRKLIHAVGPELIQNATKNFTKNQSDATGSTPTPASRPEPPATEPEPEPEFVSPAEHPSPARSPPASPEGHERADAGASSARNKRKTNTEPESPGRRKRAAPNRKTMTYTWFKDVYQEGHAETKHMIVEYPKGSDKWYIIRCQQCPRDFGDVPLRTAGAHLNSSQHGNQPRDATHVVQNFGIPVLGCDKELADKNNAVARHAFRRQGEEGPPPPDNTAASGSSHGRRGAGGIVSPTPGHIYLGYWSNAKKSWPVLLLPTANLEDVGVPETLKSLKLLESLPSCYRLGNTGEKTLEWAEGFEDGGAKVAQRRFPVMFFDDNKKFPSESEIAWLAAKDLDVLDIKSAAASDVPHIRSVQAYLRARAQIPSEADPPSEMDVHDDATSRPDDETHQTAEVDQTNSPEAGIVEPCATRVDAGFVPVAKEGEPIHFPVLETPIGAAGNSNDDLRRSLVDIISISSTSTTSESHAQETHPEEAASSLPNELNRTSSAPNADVETATSTNLSVNDPDRLSQAHTIVEAGLEPRHLVPNSPAESAQMPESRASADFLAMIAQIGLEKKLEMSESTPSGIVQQVARRHTHSTEDRTRKVPATYPEFISQLSPDNPASASDTTTIPPPVETVRNPPRVPNPNFQHQGPHAPQVENRSINSPVPSDHVHSQSQPRPNASPAPYYHIPRPKLVQEQYTVHGSDLGRTGQHISSSTRGNQGTASLDGVPGHNETWRADKGATNSQPPFQGMPHLHHSGNDWRSVNGLHERPR